MRKEDFNFELRRKTFHLYSLCFPLMYAAISKISMSIVLLPLTVFTLYLDVSRHYNKKIKDFVEKFFGKYLRTKEQSGTLSLSGASYMAAGFLISCLFFSKGLAIASWLVLIISDCVAAIVGMKYGSHGLQKKSLAGGIAFFVSSSLISIFSYFLISFKTSFIIIILSSAITAIVEFYSSVIKIDDNFSIPLSYCLVTSILSFIL